LRGKQISIAAAIQWNLRDFLASEDLPQLCVRRFHLRAVFGDHDGLVLLLHLQSHIDEKGAPDINDQAGFPVRFEAVRGHVDFVLPDG
jgi:hypothetical protein